MITNNPESIPPATAATATPPTATAAPGVKPHRLIKLGVDVHWREHVVVRQIDGTSPQPAQRFAPEAFVAWVAKQVQQADMVHCCYEAGPFGFVLHLARLSLRQFHAPSMNCCVRCKPSCSPGAPRSSVPG